MASKHFTAIFTNCIKDSFAFAQTMQDLRLEGKMSICAHLTPPAYSQMYLSIKQSAYAFYKDPSPSPPPRLM